MWPPRPARRRAAVEHARVGLGDHLETLHRPSPHVTGACATLDGRMPAQSRRSSTADAIQARVRRAGRTRSARDASRREPASRRRAEGRVRLPRPTSCARMRGDVTLDFIAVSSYAAARRRRARCGCSRTSTRPRGRDVVIVEDIVDTGLTLTYLQDILRARAPAPLRTACLLSKPSRRKVDVTVDYVGFTIEDQFVVGYGLDYASTTQPALHRRARRDADGRLRTAARTALPGRAPRPAPRPRRASAPCRSRISTRPLTIVVSHVVAARGVDQVRDRVVAAASAARGPSARR